MNPNKNQNLYIAALIVAAIGVTLLVGNRLNASWAGGTGFEKHACATVEGEEFCRGEIISTIHDAQSPLLINFGSAEIWLDQNTEVELVDGREGLEKINVIQGRIVVIGNITIETREIDTIVNGTASFVHYSWLDKIEVVSIQGTAKIEYGSSADIIDSIEMTTIEPYEITEIEFSPESSSASEFYEQVLN